MLRCEYGDYSELRFVFLRVLDFLHVPGCFRSVVTYSTSNQYQKASYLRANDSDALNDFVCFTTRCHQWDEVAEWLRRWTANPFPSGSVGSNPILVAYFFLHSPKICFLFGLHGCSSSRTHSRASHCWFYKRELLSHHQWRTEYLGGAQKLLGNDLAASLIQPTLHRLQRCSHQVNRKM